MPAPAVKISATTPREDPAPLWVDPSPIAVSDPLPDRVSAALKEAGALELVASKPNATSWTEPARGSSNTASSLSAMEAGAPASLETSMAPPVFVVASRATTSAFAVPHTSRRVGTRTRPVWIFETPSHWLSHRKVVAGGAPAEELIAPTAAGSTESSGARTSAATADRRLVISTSSLRRRPPAMEQHPSLSGWSHAVVATPNMLR